MQVEFFAVIAPRIAILGPHTGTARRVRGETPPSRPLHACVDAAHGR